MSITVVFHKDCQASVDIISKVLELKDYKIDYKIDYIDIYHDEFESDIEIDVVPIIIVDNSEVYKGKDAFDKIEQLKNPPKSKKVRGPGMYNRSITIAPEDSSSSKKKSVKI